MMPRVLDLRVDCLGHPTPHDVAAVGAMMLWPSDHELRARALNTSVIEMVFLSDAYPPPRTQSERREYLDLARSISRTTDFAEEIKEGFRRGMIAGGMLREVLLTGATLASAKTRIAAEFDMAVKTIENSIWHPKHYRPVAAYWAAYVHVMPSMRSETLIPCQPRELGVFLAIADEFRCRAEAGRSRQSPTPSVLRPGETIQIPAGIELPQGRLRL